MGHARHRSHRDGMISAEYQGESSPLERLLHQIRKARARLRDLG